MEIYIRRLKSGVGAAGLLFFTMVFVVGIAKAEVPDFYSEAAGVTKRAGNTDAPNEVIDPFSGTLNIVHNDVVIPGNGGMDIVIKRVYSSQNVYMKQGTQNVLNTLQARNQIGLGWQMHFGRIRMPQGTPCAGGNNTQADVTDNPIVEMSDGSQQILFCNNYPNTYDTDAAFVTKSNGVADFKSSSSPLNGFIYIDSNGMRYTMDFRLTSGANFVWYATRIEDRNGNFLTISYSSASERETILPTRITASDGRRVDFTYSNSTDAHRARLSRITYGSRRWTYTSRDVTNGYLFEDDTDDRFYLLEEVDLPGTNTGDWEYDYYNRSNGAAGDRNLQKITYPYGATTTYDYKYHCFMYANCSSASQYNSLVVKSKVNAGRAISSGTWNYVYSEANTFDTTTVTGPTSKEIYKHYGLYQFRNNIFVSQGNYTSQNDNLWRTGLLVEKKIQTTSGTTLQTEQYDYGSRKISHEYYSRFPYTNTKKVSDPDVFASYVTERRIIRDGTTYTTKYEDFADDLNPHKITEIGQAPDRITTLDYYPRIDGQNIVGQVKNERYGTATNRRITRTFDGNGNLKTENKYGVLTTYSYDGDGNIKSIKDARNNTTDYSRYYRGIARTEKQEEGITITRSVDAFGNVTAVNDGRSFITGYGYDSLNRLSSITYPFGSPASIAWTTTKRTLTRGSYRQIVSFDGFGRTTCTQTENIYVGEAYNAVGNRTYETYPNYSNCNSTNPKTTFIYDALNRLKRSTHPDSSYTEITYQNNNVQRMRDERGKLFYNSYRSYANPDQQELVGIMGPENLSISIGRNPLGQVTSVNRNGVTRTYIYGSSVFLTSETNPETGTTTYGRDAVGNMTSRKIGASPTTFFTYDDLNRLELTNYPSGTPDINVTYDKNSNVKTINSGIANITYTYDPNDNLTKEQQNIDGKNYFLTYRYNALDHLNSVLYADGGTVTYSPNDLGWPTKAAPYVNNIAYDAFGRPTVLTYANGRTQTQTYWNRGWPKKTTVNGGISVRERSYDAAGNLTILNDLQNNLYDRNMTYDGLNRLKTANSPAWGSGSVNYSTDDDITSKSMGTNSFIYTYSVSKNRVTWVRGLPNFITSARYNYDVYGNIIQKASSSTGWTYDYDDASNLRKVYDTNSTLLRSYDYSGQKQRVKSVKSDETRIHVVSKSGQLMNEFVTVGPKPNIANVYVGSRLVAELEGQGGPSTPPTIFGWGYGNNGNKYNYSRTFSLTKIPDRFTYCVDGYGINSNTEVSVKINGTLIGYLKAGGDPKQTCFEISGALLQVGTNTVLFTQTSPVQTWGVGGFRASSFFTASIIPPIMLLMDDEQPVN